MIDEEKSAESSAAAVAEPEFNPADQHTWSPEQREHWNTTGEQPVAPKKQESAPAASSAKEAKSEPEGKNAAESETASKQGKKERNPGEKLSAAERISQLTAKVRELETERERSRTAETKPPVTEPEAKAADTPKRPNPFDWTGTKEEFAAAQEKWEAHQRAEIINQFQREAAAEVQRQRLQGQLDEMQSKYPDAKQRIAENCNIFGKAEIPPVIRAMLNDSECLTDLMYVFDEETRTNFIKAANDNPGKAIRALAQMEADVMSKRSAPPKTEQTDKSDSKVPAETKPRAPKPPSEVGGRAAAPEDALRTAAAANDFRAFEAEETRRKFAKAS